MDKSDCLSILYAYYLSSANSGGMGDWSVREQYSASKAWKQCSGVAVSSTGKSSNFGLSGARDSESDMRAHGRKECKMPVMMEMMVVMMMIVVVVTEERLLKTHTSCLPISFCCVFLSLIKVIYPIQSGHTTTNNNNVKGVLLSFICMA